MLTAAQVCFHFVSLFSKNRRMWANMRRQQMRDYGLSMITRISMVQFTGSFQSWRMNVFHTFEMIVLTEAKFRGCEKRCLSHL